jgi:hypothetical protein
MENKAIKCCCLVNHFNRLYCRQLFELLEHGVFLIDDPQKIIGIIEKFRNDLQKSKMETNSVNINNNYSATKAELQELLGDFYL